jgi:hypothetical protein
MTFITKQDIIKAFQDNKMKRNNLLFSYYRDSLFFQGFTAEFIADKISQDLGINISAGTIYKINHRIIKKRAQSRAQPPIDPATPPPNTEQQQNLREKKGIAPGPATAWQFRNAEEYPPKDPLEDAFKDL